MSIGSTIVAALKGKLVVTALLGAVVVGGGTAAFAATPMGQNITKSITAPAQTSTPATQHGKDQNGKSETSTTNNQSGDQKNDCPGLSEAQNLAKKFSLSTDSKSATIQLICSLHTGTYKGLKHALGYGEIEDLLTYAQSLAGQEKNAANAKFSDETLSTYIAAALKTCANDPISACVKANTPTQQGTPGSSNSGNGSTNGTDHGSSGTTGKPTATPTPHH